MVRVRFIVPSLVALCCLMAGCGTPSGKPSASNRPYQVTVVGDTANTLVRELTDTVEGLPQAEPRFDVTMPTAGTLSGLQRLARAIVIVSYDKNAREVVVSCRRDVYARPQIVVNVTAPSHRELERYAEGHRETVRNVLEAFEASAQIKALKAAHNEKAEQEIRKMTGVSMGIPSDLKASKRGRDFIWLSNNTNEGLQNICVYRTRSRKAFSDVRDSVMKANVPGERDGMYMETTRAWRSRPLTTGIHLPKGAELYRGLWDVRGDAMGGAFVALKLRRNGYDVYIEGFVYAPEGSKRNKLRRLEACLYSAIVATGSGKRHNGKTIQ